MTTHDLAHGIRALESEMVTRSLSGAPGLVGLARAAGKMRRELAARGRDALLAVSWKKVTGDLPRPVYLSEWPAVDAWGDVVGNPPWPVAP